MIVLVTGGSGSGKSQLAEKISVSLKNDRLYYLATMKVWDDECRKRIEKHRIQREGKGFETVEVPVNLHECVTLLEPSQTVLLECMSNLLANEQFGGDTDTPADKITEGLKLLFERTDSAVVVSNEIFTDGPFRDIHMKEYADNLGKINCWIAERSDIVVEVSAGIPVVYRGSNILSGLL